MKRLALIALPLVLMLAGTANGARTDDVTTAAVQALREVSELHVTRFDTFCIPHADLQAIAGVEPGYVVLGMARIRGKAMYLDRQLVCDPLATYYSHQGPQLISRKVLLAISVVAHEYGHTLGLRRENVVECYAARVVWKWARRSDQGPAALAADRRFLLDNSRRPPAYKLAATCTLT